MMQVSLLRIHQWLILIAVACVLVAGIGWGLPDTRRADLLCPPSGFDDSLLTRLDASATSYFSLRDAADSTALRSLQVGAPPTPYAAPALGANLDDEERLRAVRRYVVSSCAVDERETYIALARMKPDHLDLDPRGFIYGGAYLYPVGATLFLLKSMGVIHPTEKLSVYLRHPDELRRIYIAGRSLSLLAFLGVLVLLARLGTILDRPLTGTLAMLAWSCSTLALNQSLVTKPHVWTALWALSSVYLAVRFVRLRRLRDLVLSAVAVGLAIGSSLFSAILLVLYPLLLVRVASDRSWMRPTLLALGVALMTFLATNPYLLVSPASYRVTILHHGAVAGWGYAVAGLGKALRFSSDYLLRGLPFPMGLVAFAGVVHAVVRGKDSWRRIAILTVVTFATLALFPGVSRIALFLCPLLCLFAGKAIASLPTRGRLIGVIAFIPGLFFAGLFAYDTIHDDASYAATARWLEEDRHNSIASVGIFDRPEPRNLPPMPFMSMSLVNLGEYRGGGVDPEFVVLGNYGDDRSQWLNHPLHRQYRLTHVLGYRASLDWLTSARIRSESRLAAWVYQKVE